MSPSVLRARSLAGFLGRVAAFVTQEVYLRVVFLRGVTCVALSGNRELGPATDPVESEC
jgi:hypothetical protein